MSYRLWLTCHMSTDTATTFNVEISEFDSGAAAKIEAIASFASQAEAELVAGQFPKSARVRVGRLMQGINTVCEYRVTFSAVMRAAGNTGEKNEGGYKRFISFERAAGKAGHELIVNANVIGNRPISREDLAARWA